MIVRERGMCKPSKLVVLSLIGFGLAACASAEEQRQVDTAACQRYGFAPGTPDFANCMQREQFARSQGSGSSVSIGVGGGSCGRGGYGGAGIGFGF